jgi:hypothetical protein
LKWYLPKNGMMVLENLAIVWIFLAVFMIYQRCLNDVRTMSEWCPLLFWCLKDVRLMSCCHFDYVSILFCLDIMWMIFEWCLDDVWMMSEMIFELFVDDFMLSFCCCCPFFAIDVLLISAPCLDILISMMSYWCLNDVWMLSSSSFCNVVIVFVVSIMFGWGINNIWMISEWCLNDICRMPYWCCFHFMLSKWCLDDVWMISEWCQDNVCMISEMMFER